MSCSFTVTLSLHDALPICDKVVGDHFHDWLHEVGRHQLVRCLCHKLQQLGDLLLPWVEVSLQVWVKVEKNQLVDADQRSEEHTSELQSRGHLVCRLMLEKK